MSKLGFVFLLLCSFLLMIFSQIYPAMGMGESSAGNGVLNGARHTFHSSNQVGQLLPESSCQSCHPVPQSQDLRAALSLMGIGCTDCHTGMTAMDNQKPIQGVSFITCMSCHDQETVTSIACENCHTGIAQESFWHFSTQE